MARSHIVLISDRPDRSLPLAEAIRAVAECRPAGTDETWAAPEPGSGSILGVIADIDLRRPEAGRCLARLARLARERNAPPTLLLTRGDAVSPRTARDLGADLCLPASTEPCAVVEALYRQIWPGLSQDDLRDDLAVKRGVVRAGALMNELFRSAETGTVEMASVEHCLGPVLDAIGRGGLSRWLREVWTLDDITIQHCLLVAGFAARFAQSLGLSMPDRRLMIRAALVHDVGKARIPLAILNKPGPLDAAETTVMRTHAVIGWKILTASGGCDAVTLAMTRHHHELLDGSGYPDGLSGAAIADPVRLLTICDIYSALTERRPYKAPMPSREALAVLDGMTGKLEGRLVQAFARTVHGTP